MAARLLTEKDVAAVIGYLGVLSNQEIIEIGVTLGLRFIRLKRMSPESLMFDMVFSWLRRDDDVDTVSGPPSWNTLCTALRKGGLNGIAFSIESMDTTLQGHVVRSVDVSFLVDHLQQRAYKWREIGIALGFHHGELENIRQSVPTAPVQLLLIEVLSQWSQWPTATHSDVPTVEGLCDALRSALVGLGALANSLQNKKSQLPSCQLQAPTSSTPSQQATSDSPHPSPPPPHDNPMDVSESASESLSRSELEFCANIEKHMRSSGVIDRFLAHLVLVGFPASGKTTLIYRLLNRAISIEASSTGVMDGIITVNIGEDKASMHAANIDEKMEKCLWHKVEFSLSCLRQMGMLSSQLSHTPSHVSQHREATTDPAADHDLAASDHGPATEDSQPMKVVLTTIQKTLQEKGYSADGFREILPYLSNKTTLYLSDTGGQVEFQELLPLLVAGCAIFLFLFPLNKDLDQPVRVSYRKKGGGETNAYTSSLTIEKSFLQTLSSIDSMQTGHPTMKQSAHRQHNLSTKPSSDFKHRPAVFVVGTHKDCLIKELGEAGAKKKIEAIEERIKELVTKHRYGELVMLAKPAKNKILFAISNNDVKDKKFQKIRSRIMNLIREEDRFHIEFPLSYLLASMQLDGKNVPFVKRSDFAKDVLQYGIKEEDIDHVLHFLHTRIGQIRYFSLEGIREDIVKEPQVLYDIVTNLITESFLLPGNVAQASEVKRGVYSVESFSKHSHVLETSRLIALLQELRIVALFVDQKSNKRKLFIPCVLNHLEEPAKSDGGETSMVQPLAIIFECGHCPKGMFGVLLHYIITQHSKDWNLNIQTIFRDQVSFQVRPYNDVVTLKFHTAYLEVRYFPDCVAQRSSASTEKKICNKIHSVLESGIKQATTSLRYSPERTKFDFGLVCTACHLAHEVTEGFTMKCPKKTSSALPNSGSFWFKIPTYSFSEQFGDGDTVLLKKGNNPPKQFAVSSESSCSQHALTKMEYPPCRTDHIYLEQNTNTICFRDIDKCDERVYRISSHNDVGSGQMLFKLKLKRVRWRYGILLPVFGVLALLFALYLGRSLMSGGPDSKPSDFEAAYSNDATLSDSSPKCLPVDLNDRHAITIQRLIILHYKKNGERKRFRIIKKISGQWEDLGLMLEVEIDHFKSKDVEECCREMLREWLDEGTDEHVSWNAFIKVLENLEMSRIASNIKEALECVIE